MIEYTRDTDHESDGEEVDLLLFRVGPTTYAADAALIARIDRPSEGAYSLPALGRLTEGKRAVVFKAGAEERQLRIDEIIGVKTVLVGALRRMPSAASARSYAIGFWLDAGNTPVTLIDLLATSSE